MAVKYFCPICNKRACDSNKKLEIRRLSTTNESKADVLIKCHNCKSSLAVNVYDTSLMSARKASYM